MNIIDRNGNKLEFNQRRIFNAVSQAFKACDYNVKDETIQEIINDVQIWDNIHIEDIQDQVEEVLGDWGYNDVATEYKLYRKERAMQRLQRNALMKKISEKYSATNIENQNANVDEASAGGRLGEASRVVSKEYALKYIMSNMSRINHEENMIYVHDLDSYAVGLHNCLMLPVGELLAKGFNTRQTDIRPASSVSTAFQLLAVLFQVQSLQQFGGVACNCVDWVMVPYVRKSFHKHVRNYIDYVLNGHYEESAAFKNYNLNSEAYPLEGLSAIIDSNMYDYAYNLTKKETYQAVEGMYHNLNSLQSRSGN